MMMDHSNDSYLELVKQIGIALQQEKVRWLKWDARQS
jgi:hypothetical protein